MILSFFKKPILLNREEITPQVTLMIAAYNEEKFIAQKIQNSLEIDYPRDKLKILVVSDGSTDRTDQIVRDFPEAELLRVEGRVGKTEARNQAVLNDKSEIIVFSDATAVYEKDAIRKLVRNFADPSVGMVSGHLKYRDQSNGSMGLSTKMYWFYEKLIKKYQSHLRTLTGAVGCINAFRRELYHVLPPHIIEDFTEPLMIVAQNYRVVYEREAIAYERTTQNAGQEFKMRIRVIRGGMSGFLYALPKLVKSGELLAVFQLVSHKVMRWLMPVFFIALFILSGLLALQQSSSFISLFFSIQAFCYIMAIIGIRLRSGGMIGKLLSIPSYFVVVNAASLVALYKTMTSKLESTWETNIY